jgi:predicted RNase H-like nuclease (RuvC/YqgF family)
MTPRYPVVNVLDMIDVIVAKNDRIEELEQALELMSRRVEQLERELVHFRTGWRRGSGA